jgi:hypothetical protein
MSSGRWGHQKPRSVAHEAKLNAARHQKQRRGEIVDDTVASGAVQGARSRVRTRAQKDTLEALAQAVEGAMENNRNCWGDRSIPYEELKNEIDPECAEEMALLAAAIRNGTDLETFKARVARSRQGAKANAMSRKAGAEAKRKGGYKKKCKVQVMNADGLTTFTRIETFTAAQVQEQARRCRELNAMPDHKRPTFPTQTSAPGKNPLLKFQGTGKSHNPGALERELSLAEMRAHYQAQPRVTGPYFVGAGGRITVYWMKIPKSLWSDGELTCMGFRPWDKPKRAFSFSGPTAKADAEAFDEKMTEWLEKWKKGVGPPPQP